MSVMQEQAGSPTGGDKDKKVVESRDDEDGWLNAIRDAVSSKGKPKQQFNFDVFNVPLEKMFPHSVIADKQELLREKELEKTAPMEIVVGTRFTCRVCGFEFSAMKEMHEHFKSPLHVVNLKRSLIGLEAVDTDNDINSDNDDDDDNFENDDDALPTGEQNMLEHMQYSQDGKLSTENMLFQDGWVRKHNHKTNGSVIIFRKRASNWEFSVSSAIYNMSLAQWDEESQSRQQDDEEDPWNTLKNTLQIFHLGEKLHSCVLVLQSGMFAGAVFEGNKCILHKVFRRYTVRAKAGGGQSSFDSNGRKAKSAGATLRRYGEQALKEDIQALLSSWLPFLQSSVVVLTAIPKTMKHYIFSDSLQRDFHRDDPRIKTIPFMIKKPTFEEIKLAHQKCMLIEFSFVKELEQEQQQPSRALHPVVEEPETLLLNADIGKDDEEEISPLEAVVPEEVCGLLRELLADLTRGKGEHFNQIMKSIAVAAAGADCVASGDVDQHQCQSMWLSTPHSLDQLETPLHVAAAVASYWCIYVCYSSGGFSREVFALLQAGASPAVTDIRNRYPYFLAKDKDTRDAFRRYRGELEEREGEKDERGACNYLSSWDWTLCGIPAGITSEMLREKKEKEKEKKKKAKQRKQNAKLEKVEADALEVLAKEKAVAEKKELEIRNYKLVGECGFCQKSLMGIVPLDIFDRRCCSSGCVVMMRRKLTAEAAEKRAQQSK